MIYFVRHGQTDDNVRQIFTGQAETPLNSVGYEQARQVAIELKDVNFDICFCSPLLRTRQTLDEILKFHQNLQVIYDERIKERDYGRATGKPFTDFNFHRWNINDKLPCKMESIQTLFNRVKSFYDEILKKYPNKSVLVVAHSGVARMSMAYFNGMPSDGDFSKLTLGNAKCICFDNKKLGVRNDC